MAKRVSNTKVGIVPPITSYDNGKERSDVARQYLNIIPAGVVGANAFPSGSLNSEYISEDPELNSDDPSNPISPDLENTKKIAPNLSDIELVSNTVVYDSLNNATSTVVFKVRNSSSTVVKSVNARVQVL